MAARRAMGVYAYGEAAGHLERCLQVHEVLSPDDKETRCDLLLSLGDALMPPGEPRRVYETVAAESFALAEAIADRPRASRACRVALDALSRYGGAAMWTTPEYRQWADRADQYAEPGTSNRVFADLALSWARLVEGNLTDAMALRVRALELARKLDDPEALYRAATAFILGAPIQHEGERWRLVTEMADQPHVGVPDSPPDMVGSCLVCFQGCPDVDQG